MFQAYSRLFALLQVTRIFASPPFAMVRVPLDQMTLPLWRSLLSNHATNVSSSHMMSTSRIRKFLPSIEYGKNMMQIYVSMEELRESSQAREEMRLTDIEM